MMKPACIALVFLLAAFAPAQVTRTEATHAAKDPAEDSKPNSDSVPSAIAVSSQFDRVVILRVKYDTDLLSAMEQIVKEQKIHNAVIISGIGALRNYALHHVINRTLPDKVAYIKDPTGSADIIGMSGYIFDSKIHAHITLSSDKGVLGGHLDPGNKVFIYAIVTMGVLPDGLDLSKFEDPNYR
jgi:predicted DNA-binding protein with PD1-like motif